MTEECPQIDDPGMQGITPPIPVKVDPGLSWRHFRGTTRVMVCDRCGCRTMHAVPAPRATPIGTQPDRQEPADYISKCPDCGALESFEAIS